LLIKLFKHKRWLSNIEVNIKEYVPKFNEIATYLTRFKEYIINNCYSDSELVLGIRTYENFVMFSFEISN
jgi:hypothetical protein